MRIHALRLPPGADLRAGLEGFAADRGISAGFILSAVGGLGRARLRLPGLPGASERLLELEQPVELLTLQGTLSPDGAHLHATVSRGDGGCLGGHVAPGCIVNTTAEVVVGEAPGLRFARTPDPATGYAELHVTPRPPRA